MVEFGFVIGVFVGFAVGVFVGAWLEFREWTGMKQRARHAERVEHEREAVQSGEPAQSPSLLRKAVVADARTATPEQLARGAAVYASLREPKTVRRQLDG